MNIFHTAIAAAVATMLIVAAALGLGRFLTYMLDHDSLIVCFIVGLYIFVFAFMWSGQ